MKAHAARLAKRNLKRATVRVVGVWRLGRGMTPSKRAARESQIINF